MKRFFTIFILIGSFASFAQTNGIYTTGKNPFFNFLSYSGEFRTEGNYDIQNRENQNYNDLGKISSLSAGLKFNTKSYLWHPNFVKIDLGAEFNPETKSNKHREFDNRQEVLSKQRVDFKATFFDHKVISLSAFVNYLNGRRNVENIDRIFINNFQWGGDLISRNKYIPFYLYFKDFKIRQEHILSERIVDIEGKSVIGRVTKSFSKRDSHQFKYNYNEYLRNQVDFYSMFTTTHKFYLNNKFFFDAKRRNIFNSAITHRIQTGILSYNNLVILERLSFQLPKRFNLTGDYSYNKFTTDTSSKVQHGVRGELSHKLFESLRSRIYTNNAFISQTYYNEKNIKAGLNLQYDKKIPYGKLTVVYKFEKFIHSTESNSQTIYVYNEEHTLNDGEFVLLDRAYVDPASIIVKDLSESQIYQLNFDYVIFERDNFIEIQRVPGGQIENFAMIHVDYSAEQPGNYGYDMNYNFLNAKVSFFKRALELTYSYSQRDYTNLFQSDFIILDYMKQHLFGVSTNKKWFTAGIEYYDRRSVILPHQLWRYYVNSQIVIKDFSVFINASIKDYHLVNENTDQTYYTINGKTSYKTGTNSKINLDIGYTSQKGEKINLDLLSGRLEFQQTIRQLSYMVGLQYFHRYLTNDKTNLSGAYFRLIRRF